MVPWDALRAQLDGDKCERLAALAHLQAADAAARLTDEQALELASAVGSLLRDSDAQVCAAALAALRELAADGRLEPHLLRLIPAVIDRLGSGHEPVRAQAAQVLLALMRRGHAAAVLERLDAAWGHRTWRLRAELPPLAAAAAALSGVSQEQRMRLALQPLVTLLEDPHHHVRPAAARALHSLQPALQPQLATALQASRLPPEGVQRALQGLDPEPPAPATRVPVEQAPPEQLPPPPQQQQQPQQQLLSQQQARARLEQLLRALDPAVDWERRAAALLELEQLVQAGAARLPLFPEFLKALLQPLQAQLADRRSSVSKQACALIAALAQQLRRRFEPQAAQLLPELFKVLVISVQVMSEAADACAAEVLAHCHAPRLLLAVCERLRGDRSAKLRAHCAGYLLQALQGWEAQELEACLGEVQTAVLSALQDALPETRAAGRAAALRLGEAWPGQLRAFAAGLEPHLLARLQQALACSDGTDASEPDCSVARRRSTGSAPGSPATPPRPPRAALHSPGKPAQEAAHAPRTAVRAALRLALPPHTAAAGSHRHAPPSRHEDGRAGAARSLGSPVRRASCPGTPKAPPTWAAPKTAARVPAAAPGSIGARWPGGRAARSSSLARSGSLGGRSLLLEPADALPDAGAVIQALRLGCTKWQEKVRVLEQAAELVEAAPQLLAAPAAADVLADALTQLSGDPHIKAATLALALTAALLPALPEFWRAHRLLQIMPALLMRHADTRDAVKRLSVSATAAFCEAIPLTLLLPGLSRALHGTKAPRVVCACLETFAAVAAGGGSLAGAEPPVLRAWEQQLARLSRDKNGEIRVAAAAACQAVAVAKGSSGSYTHLERASVTSASAQSSPDRSVCHSPVGAAAKHMASLRLAPEAACDDDAPLQRGSPTSQQQQEEERQLPEQPQTSAPKLLALAAAEPLPAVLAAAAAGHAHDALAEPANGNAGAEAGPPSQPGNAPADSGGSAAAEADAAPAPASIEQLAALVEAASREPSAAGLLQLRQALLAASPRSAAAFTAEIVAAVSGCVSDAAADQQDRLAAALQLLAAALPAPACSQPQTQQLLPGLLKGLLACWDLLPPQAEATAETCVTGLCRAAPEACLAVAAAHVAESAAAASPDEAAHESAQAAVQALEAFTRLLPPASLQQAADSAGLLPALGALCSSGSPALRRAVVTCLASLRQALGEPFGERMAASLSVTQLKLVELFARAGA